MSELQSIREIVKRNTSHIAGMFVIHADGSFLNGDQNTQSEDKNKTNVKKYWNGKKPIPYVSSQSWRRWLRNTLIEETGWKMSIIEAVLWNEKENTSKIAGQLNPIEYPEDDIFGYMWTKKSKNEKKINDNLRRERLPDVQLVRTSPFKSSLLSGIPDLTFIKEDKGFVHLKDDEPLPYTTEFYSGELSAIFGLEIVRLGVFQKKGKKSQELDPYLLEQHEDKLEKIEHPIYPGGEVVYRKDLVKYQNELASELMKSLVRLRGGSKLAQFGTDVAPRCIIVCGLSTGNMLFDDLIISMNGKPGLNIAALKEIVSDYSDKITTPVFIGMRTGYLANEDDVKELKKIGDIDIIHGSPIEVIDEFVSNLN